MIEGTVSVHLHKGNKVARSTTYTWGAERVRRRNERGRAVLHPRSPGNEREQGSKHLLLLRWLGRILLILCELNSEGQFIRCPRKSKAGTCDQNPNRRSLSQSPESGCEQACHTVKCLAATPKTAVFSPQKHHIATILEKTDDLGFFLDLSLFFLFFKGFLLGGTSYMLILCVLMKGMLLLHF